MTEESQEVDVMMKEANPLVGWSVDREQVGYVGDDLRRPECVVAEQDGTLWVADLRGAVVKISPGGPQAVVVPCGAGAGAMPANTLPNGIALAADGSVLVANFGTQSLQRVGRDGQTEVLLDQLDGRPLGSVNFVLRDSADRLWVTVSTHVTPWNAALRPGFADGYILLLEAGRARVVAEGFSFTNEIRLDAKEEWLYISETGAKRISRMRVSANGDLSDREVFGPDCLGAGFPDGIAFDAHGNLWVTMVWADRLLAITPDQQVISLLDDGNAEATRRLEAQYRAGAVRMDTVLSAHGDIAPGMCSLAFGGPDLRTVYLGSLAGTRLATFRSPVAGLPMVHWQRGGAFSTHKRHP